MAVDVLNYFEQANLAGDNKLILGGTVKTGSGNFPLRMRLVVTLPDITESTSSVFVFPNTTGVITKITGVLTTTVPTSGTSIITAKIGAATVGGSMSFTSSDALGGGKNFNPTASNTIAAGQTIQILSDGGSVHASLDVPLTVMIEIAQS